MSDDTKYADDCVKYLIKHLARTMQRYKRNPSMGLAYEIGNRQRGLDLFPHWNDVSIEYTLKVAIMNNAVNRFVYKFIDKNLAL